MNVGFTATAQWGTEDTTEGHISNIVMSGGKMIAGTLNNRLYLSTDSGKLWKLVYKDAPGKYDYISTLLVSGDKVFALSRGTLLLSTDHGATWKPIRIVPDNPGASYFAKFRDKLYAVSNYKLYQSADEGNTWAMIPAIGDTDVRKMAANEEYIMIMVYDKKTYRYNYCTSTDGIKWNSIKDVEEMELVEERGNYMTCQSLGNTLNVGEDLTLIRGASLYVLTKNGKKLQRVGADDMEEELGAPRYFTIDKDKIYALTVSVKMVKIKKTKQYECEYKRRVIMTEDLGKNWTEVNDTTEPFLLSDYWLQQKKMEMEAWKKEEMHEAFLDLQGAEINKELAAQAKAEIKRSHKYGGYQSYGTLPAPSSGPNYQQLSNDRFKEKNNHRDSWIDSKGQIHSN